MHGHRADEALRDAILRIPRAAALQDAFRRGAVFVAAVLGAIAGGIALGAGLWTAALAIAALWPS